MMASMKRALLALMLLWGLPALADDKAGVAVTYEKGSRTFEARLMNNAVDANFGFNQKAHGGFLVDFEADRIPHHIQFSSGIGYEVFTQYKRFQPFAYALAGATSTTGSGSVFTSFNAQGMDFRLNNRYSLRYEHESDWSRVQQHQWDQRSTFLLVIKIK